MHRQDTRMAASVFARQAHTFGWLKMYQDKIKFRNFTGTMIYEFRLNKNHSFYAEIEEKQVNIDRHF